ncbi:MAG TPA: tRNA lysidine(34) synthetase TilS [Steroidobacteraceae bacterium]
MRPAPFGPRWLRAHMTALLPNFSTHPICVAYSGGVDSTALLAVVARIPRLKLRALHINHGLHPLASAWSAHCQTFARELGVPLRVVRVQVPRTPGESLEAQARDARYAAFARELKADEILMLAHQADDQLETVFLQLLRGAGVAGIAAMPRWARFAGGWLARPLLERPRAELAAWLSARRLAWVEDVTNADERLDRNYLRRQVLPRIRSRWPASASAVARSARHAAQAQHMLEELGRADVNKAADGAALSVTALRALSPERRSNALRVWIAQGGWPVPNARRLAELAGPVLEARCDANPALAWAGVVARRHGDRLGIHPPGAAAPDAELAWAWRTTPKLMLPCALGTLALVADVRGPLDVARLPDELSVRWRRGGERLRPRSRGPSRALKTLLQEAKVPPDERARLPLIFAGAQLLAVADLYSDASIQASSRTARRARIHWQRP